MRQELEILNTSAVIKEYRYGMTRMKDVRMPHRILIIDSEGSAILDVQDGFRRQSSIFYWPQISLQFRTWNIP